MSQPRKLRPYFLHNIDGRSCAIAWAHNKRDFAKAVRARVDEIRALEPDKEPAQLLEGMAVARADPGAIYGQPINARQTDAPWVLLRYYRIPVDGVAAP